MDIFLCDIHIIVTKDANKSVDARGLRVYAESELNEDLTKECDGFVFQKKCSGYYVLLSPNAGFNTIAHETVHIIGYVFKDRGVKANYDNDELFAYYVGWIAEIMAGEMEEANKLFGE
jgi:hypothetical protein